MSIPNEEINKLAQERFQALKNKMRLKITEEIQQNEHIAATEMCLTEKEFQELQQEPLVKYIKKEQMSFVDNSFNFIESLNLPPQLSLAIGYIISAAKTRNISEFAQAKEAIQKEIDTAEIRYK